MPALLPGTRYRARNAPCPNEPSAETLELVAEPEREVEKEVEMFGCAIEGEGQC
jgi:hypothetical protein